MPLAAILPFLAVAAPVAGALISAHGANQAADTQAAAANNASQTQMSMYNQTRSDLSGYNTAGMGAVSQLANLFGLPGMGGSGGGAPNAAAATSALTQFPGYQFGLNQGTQALDRSAASRGLLLSGAQLKDTQQFGQGYAMEQAWQPYVSELNQVAGLGESAGAQVGSDGTTAAGRIGASQIAAGEAGASGQVSNANVFSNLVQNQQLQSALTSNLRAPSRYNYGTPPDSVGSIY